MRLGCRSFQPFLTGHSNTSTAVPPVNPIPSVPEPGAFATGGFGFGGGGGGVGGWGVGGVGGGGGVIIASVLLECPRVTATHACTTVVKSRYFLP